MKSRGLRVAVVVAAVLCVWVVNAHAQSVPWHIVQGSDGTLYAVYGSSRVTVAPDLISDDDLAALTDLGGTTSLLPQLQAQQSQSPTPTPAPAPTAAPALALGPEQPITLTGTGDVNTRPFTLRGGNYTSTWSTSGRTGCFFGANVKPVNSGTRFFGADAGNGQSQEGQTQIYNIPAGDYYVGVLSTCPKWTLTLNPLS